MAGIAPLPSPGATLDIDLLKTLVAIADAGSVTGAAARVGRSPGAVSMQLKRLEETIGRPLFERSRQGMELTGDGERLLAYARRIVDLHREALDAFRCPDLEGSVRIGTIDDFGVVRLSEVLAAFARSHPRVTVDVTLGPSADLGPRLERGELDLSLLTPGCSVPWRNSDRLIHDEPLVWVGRDGGRAWRERPLPLALSSPGCAWRRAALDALDRANIPYRVAYTSDHYEGEKAAIQADLAIAPLPRSLIEPGLMQVRASELPGAIGTSRIALRLGADPSEATLALAERIAESYGAAVAARGAA
jgi:molybdate transport repressor ModE-like protein